MADARSSGRGGPRDARVWASETASAGFPAWAAPAGVGAGFGRSQRVRRPADYANVFAVRRTLRSRHFILNFAPNQLVRARLGLVVGRRMVKRAVARNLLKRLAREAFRVVHESLPALDLVLRVTAPLEDVGRRELRAEIDSLLRRLVAQ